jgi:hypothetical protein
MGFALNDERKMQGRNSMTVNDLLVRVTNTRILDFRDLLGNELAPTLTV